MRFVAAVVIQCAGMMIHASHAEHHEDDAAQERSAEQNPVRSLRRSRERVDVGGGKYTMLASADG
eukprot:3264434-Rhodomonas_salina.1